MCRSCLCVATISMILGGALAAAAQVPVRESTAVPSLADERPRRTRSRQSTPELLAAAVLQQGDANQDQQLTRAEFAELADRWYVALDASKAGMLRQEEFLHRFEQLISPASGSMERSFGRLRPSRYVGLFVVIDTDKDGSITRGEFEQRFEHWFRTWVKPPSNELTADTLLAGWQTVLPRTNMGIGTRTAPQNRLPGLPEPPPSPVLAAKQSMETIQLVDGFHLELAASEPMIEDPIALSFDADGRLYVVEMRSYMLDIDGTGERNPIGRISRLEDTDGDGQFDKSTVFVDALVLPRAAAALDHGLLYVADYQLYYAADTDGDGVADHRELVDANYGGGNIEHAPNGLMTAMDNWIYNARSRFRYRWIGHTLVKQTTENRGQWGITQDNFGRLFYNVNNSQLLGDYTPPKYMNRNPHHPSFAGLNLFVATDQRVFPRRMNTAVNRGYLPDVLDSTGKLYVFASSCSPVIYRGDSFPASFVGNAFVCDSAANLIKRNLVFDGELTLTSEFAYEGFEFLASTDERFRPVALSNGPDGALWVVDMYRGINQYSIFMTDYLRQESLQRGLDKGIHLGRIYRIVSDAKPAAAFPRLSGESSAALVHLLAHANGWMRDAAQRLLVQRADRSVIPQLIKLVNKHRDPLARLHALWTIEGLHVQLPEGLSWASNPSAVGQRVRLLEVDPQFAWQAPNVSEDTYQALYDAIRDEHHQVQINAIRVAEALTRSHPEEQAIFRGELGQMVSGAAAEIRFQIALSAGNLAKPATLPLLVEVATRDVGHLLLREAIVSGLFRWEIPFLKMLLADARWHEERPGRASLLETLATAVLREAHPVNVDELLHLAVAQRSPELAWRRRSLLTGLVARTGSRTARPLRMKGAPPALAELGQSDDPVTRALADKIRERLAWPGHQDDELLSRPAGRRLTAAEQQLVSVGEQLFGKVCAGCHGLDGRGIRPLAAPLVDSDWVLGSEERLIRVLLHGLTGAVEVDGIIYQPPIVLAQMPAVGSLDDESIASILSYIRRAWGHEAEPIAATTVAATRRGTANRTAPWTARELAELEE